MRHVSVGGDLHAQRALGGQGDAVVSGFSVDQESRAARVLVRDRSAQRVALLADNKEQSDGFSAPAEPFAGNNLGGDDSLGVTGTAPVNVRFVLP